MEGYQKLGSLAQKYNNPGNLRQWGEVPIVNGYAKFATIEHGWRALKRQVERLIDRNLTLYEFFGGKPNVYPGYAPAADNNHPKHYAEFVAQRAGIAPDKPLLEVINANS